VGDAFASIITMSDSFARGVESTPGLPVPVIKGLICKVASLEELLPAARYLRPEIGGDGVRTLLTHCELLAQEAEWPQVSAWSGSEWLFVCMRLGDWVPSLTLDA
jgi:hypothetical protein